MSDPDITDPDDSGQEESRHAMVATAETLQNGGGIPQHIRVSATTELKEFSGKDRYKDRARSWISKVKSAFLRDHAPDKGKCLVLENLLTGPARRGYNSQVDPPGRSGSDFWIFLWYSIEGEVCL